MNLPGGTKCVWCTEVVTVAREISLVWQAWNALKPVECNTDTIGLERHSSGQFQLQPKAGACMPVQTGNHHHLQLGIPTSQEHKFTAQLTPSSDHTSFLVPGSATQVYSPDIVSPISPEHRKMDSPIGDTVRSDFSTINEAIQGRNLHVAAAERAMVSPIEGTLSPTGLGLSANSIERSSSTASFQPIRLARARTILNSDKSKSSKFLPIRRKEPPASSAGDTSSLSSGTLDRQKMEEISLKELINASKVNGRGSRPKNVNVYLSQNSTHALFWTQSSIHVWDVGMSPPSPIRAISAESSCLMAAVTKTYLAYVIGTRDQKLTVRDSMVKQIIEVHDCPLTC